MHKVWGNRVSGAYAMYCILFYVVIDAFAYLFYVGVSVGTRATGGGLAILGVH